MTKRPHGIRCTIAKGRDVLRWIDPTSLHERERVLGTNVSEEDKLRAMLLKEQELEAGIASPPARLLWTAFLEEFERLHFPKLQPGTQARYRATFRALKRHVNIKRVADLTSLRIEYFAAKLREQKLSPASIQTDLRQLKTVLAWGKRRGLVAVVPEIDRADSGETGAKGRPLDDAEVEQFVAAIPKVFDDAPRQTAWAFLVRGLSLSGLRLAEAVALTWDDPTKPIVCEVQGCPVVHFPLGSQKSRREESVPITPDFLALLETVPVDRRTGKVFPLAGVENRRFAVHSASTILSQIGKASGIVVKRYPHNGKEKFASAHDLRRTFGQRWAILPDGQLTSLMRHRDAATTRKYYATGDLHALASAVQKAYVKAG